MRCPTERPASRRGAATVELAFVLPFLTVMFIMAVDYARVFYYAQIVENCARNGAYYASNYSPQIYAYPDVASAVAEDAKDLTPAPSVTTRYSANADGPYTSTLRTTGFVEVTVSWSFNSL